MLSCFFFHQLTSHNTPTWGGSGGSRLCWGGTGNEGGGGKRGSRRDLISLFLPLDTYFSLWFPVLLWGMGDSSFPFDLFAFLPFFYIFRQGSIFSTLYLSFFALRVGVGDSQCTGGKWFQEGFNSYFSPLILLIICWLFSFDSYIWWIRD